MAVARKKVATKTKKTEKVYVFSWEGKDKNGKPGRGEISAPSEVLAKALLRRQGVLPKKVRKKSQGLFGGGGGKVKPKDISDFTRQMSTMQSAGFPFVQAVDMVGTSHEKASVRTLLLDVKSQIEAGNNIASSFRKHPECFTDLYCNLVEAGEKAGILDAILKSLADYLEKTESIKSKIKKALIYPAAVLLVAGLVTTIIMIFVIPQFKETFSSFGASLPALTELVIKISEFFVAYWWLMLGVLVGGVVVFANAYKKSPKLRQLLDRIMLKIPVFGVIFKDACIARFSRTLSTMFAAGTPITEAMDSVSGATGNYVYEQATLVMKKDISSGIPLNVSMRSTALFPAIVSQMVSVGEESGALDAMLSKVADMYEEKVDNAVDNISTLIEPIMIVILGVIVGTIVIAMYLPIFKLGSTV